MKKLKVGQIIPLNKLFYKVLKISPKRGYYYCEIYPLRPQKTLTVNPIGVEMGRITIYDVGHYTKEKTEALIPTSQFGMKRTEYEASVAPKDRPYIEWLFAEACKHEGEKIEEIPPLCREWKEIQQS